MKKKSSGDIWFFLILFFVFGTTGILPLLIIAGIVFALMHFALKQSKAQEQNRTYTNSTMGSTPTYSHGYTERTGGNTHTASDLAKINVFLRKYFQTRAQLDLANNLQLVVRTGRYNTFSNLDVYRNGVRIGTVNDFRSQYPELYNNMFETLLKMSGNASMYVKPNIVEAEFTESKPQEKPAEAAQTQTKSEPVKKETPKKEEVKPEREVTKFMRQINELNADIPDEEVTNGLYEMTALLKQVDMLESKFPDSKDKMKKMYEYYLPYMVQILETFENIQTIRSDANYQKNLEQLRNTIRSINQALNNIIPSMSDSEFTNLSVDMATLEALLQRDGLTGGMEQPFSKQ